MLKKMLQITLKKSSYMITLMTFKYKTAQVWTVFKNEIHKLIG